MQLLLNVLFFGAIGVAYARLRKRHDLRTLGTTRVAR
jgi:hypothetical protein